MWNWLLSCEGLLVKCDLHVQEQKRKENKLKILGDLEVVFASPYFISENS
jgi:hypothetical protein